MLGYVRASHSLLTKEWYNRCVFGLADKLRNDPNIVQASLGIGNSHDAVEPVDTERTTTEARVIPAVLRSRVSVEIEVDPDSVFTSPANGLEDV